MTPATLLHMQQHARGENNNRSERYLEKLLLLGRHSCVWRNKFPPYFPLRWGPFGGLVDVSAPPFIICMQAGDTDLASSASLRPPLPLAWRGVGVGDEYFRRFRLFARNTGSFCSSSSVSKGGGGGKPM